MSTLDEQKKVVLPFLQRAEEIKEAAPKIAYYCRLYAVEQAMQLPKRAPEIDDLVRATISQLEKDKPKAKLDSANDRYDCEQFAINIFRRADKVDRAGKADINTSKAFYASSVFLDILHQFGDLESDLFEKQKYALWRAAEIRKAIRENRAPSFPPGQEPDASDERAAATQGGAPAPGSPFPPVFPPHQDFPLAAATYSSTFPQNAASPADSLPPPPGFLPAASTLTASSQGSSWPVSPYQPGSRVLFSEDGLSAPEPGTVGKVLRNSMYLVALRDRIIEASAEQLAPNFPEGTPVACLISPPGQVRAIVRSVNGSIWPPEYLVSCEDSREVVVQAHQLSSAVEQQAGVPTASFEEGPGAVPRAALPASEGELYPKPFLPDAPQPGSFSSQTPPHIPTKPVPSSAAHSTPPHFNPAPATKQLPTQPAANAPTSLLPTPVANFQPSLAAVTEAQKLAKFAVNSLSFDDVPNAVKYLHDALLLLMAPSDK